MIRYRTNLPQLSRATYLTDGGLETTLLFKHGIDLPYFAAFDLLKNEEGIKILENYYQDYLNVSKPRSRGFILEAPTWRANPDWAAKMGYDLPALDALNNKAIELLEKIRLEHENSNFRLIISGCVGPRGDGYVVENRMTVQEAEAYHSRQIKTFAESNADLVTAMTINYTAEAIGIVKAAKALGIPVVISYTVETDGRLPSGETLEEGIKTVDEETDNYAAYFMINCAHPDHFIKVLQPHRAWMNRIKGIRANASTKSHAELDESTTLDEGNKDLLAEGYKQVSLLLPDLNIIGGCCGTDHTHLEKICELWFGK